MATVTHDFDALAGYNAGTSVAEFYQPTAGNIGPGGWLLDTAAAKQLVFRFTAADFSAGPITVVVHHYNTLAGVSGAFTLSASLAAQQPNVTTESTQNPGLDTAATASPAFVTTQFAPQATTLTVTAVDAAANGYPCYLSLTRTDANTLGNVVVYAVSLSYSDGTSALAGPATSTVGNVPLFNAADGTLLQNSSIVGSRVVQSQTSAPASGTVAVFSGTGIEITQGSSNISSLVKNTGSSVVANNLVKFFDTTGLDVRDAGIPAANVVNVTGQATGDAVEWNGTIWVPKLRDAAVLASAFTITSTTFADITGLSVTLPRAGRYAISVGGACSTVTTAQALQFCFNFTGTITSIGASGLWSTPTAGYFSYQVQTANNALAQSATTGTAAANAFMQLNYRGGITVTTSGTLTFRGLRPTASGTTTVLAGTSMMVIEV